MKTIERFGAHASKPSTLRRLLTTGVPTGALVLGIVLVSPAARSNTISGFTAAGNPSETACMGKWDSAVINTCTSTTINAHIDIGASTASPDHYYAHVYGGATVDPIRCWGESWSYDGLHANTGSVIATSGTPHNQDFDLGTVPTLNTHSVVCTMGPGSAIHAVDG